MGKLIKFNSADSHTEGDAEPYKSHKAKKTIRVIEIWRKERTLQGEEVSHQDLRRE